MIPDPTTPSTETFGLPPHTPRLIAKVRAMTPELRTQIFPTEKDPK